VAERRRHARLRALREIIAVVDREPLDHDARVQESYALPLGNDAKIRFSVAGAARVPVAMTDLLCRPS